MGALNMASGQHLNRGLGASELPAVGDSGQRAGPPPDSRLRGGAPSYRSACWSGCRWARADGPGGKHDRNRGVNTGRGRATRALISPTQPPPCGARTTSRGGLRLPRSGSGTDGLNPIQGSRASPPFPQLLFPHLHPSSISFSGRRRKPAPPTTNPALAWRSLSLGTNRPPPAT